MGLFGRKRKPLSTLPPLRLEAAAILASGAEHDYPWMQGDTFDVRSFLEEMWSAEVMPSVEVLGALDTTPDDFYMGANLDEQWTAADRTSREEWLVKAVQWANMLDQAEYDELATLKLHATLQLKALSLALGCDASYGTDYLQRLAADPLQFGVHEIGQD